MPRQSCRRRPSAADDEDEEIDLNEDEVVKLLDKIEIKFIRKDDDKLIFEIPEFRRLDLEREIDLVEEVARIYGYDNIEGDTNFNVNVENTSKYGASAKKTVNEISNHLIGRGFNQILTASLQDDKKSRDSKDSVVRLINSVSADINSLRTDLITGALKVISNNYNNSGKNLSLKFFETGRTFVDTGNKFEEEDRLMMAISGKKDSSFFYH